MTTIHIFLGSSLDELHLDRMEIGNYVRKLNDIYRDRDVYIKLYECEDENAAMVKGRKQEEYNEEIRQSDIFLVLFYNKAGQYTIEEFREAYKQFQKTGAPAILTCFRQGEGYAPEQSVLEFMDELDKQLGHYFKRYTHIDSVKLTLLLQMKLMKLDVPIELEESLITVGGTPVLTLKNIPMWAKNADFQSLKEQYQACERAYLDAKAATTDPVTDPVFLRASEQWNEAKKALRELEQYLFSIALKIEKKNNDGTLTERQRKAYELMEQGDAEGAEKIMNLREILDDVEHAETLAQQANKKLEQHVQELLLRIEILQTQVQNPSRFAKIQETFEEAVALEKRRNLKKIAMREYVSYLHDQKDYSHAIPLAERYLKYVELDGDKSDVADAANMLGILYTETNRMELAEQEHLRAKEIQEQLATENPSVYLMGLAMSCNNLGELYRKNNRIKLAEREYLRARKIYDQLTAEHLSAYRLDLAGICNNLGVLYVDTNRLKLAEKEHLRAKEIYEQLVAENPSAYLPYLANGCNNLGSLYYKNNCIDMAMQEYLRAKEIRGQLAIENPSAYQPALADTCNNLGILYADTNRLELAEQEYLRSKEICEQLAAENPSAYQPDLASTCNNLGNLYYRNNCMDMAKQEYLRAKKIYEQLAAENPSAYQPDLANTCHNLGNLYKDTDCMDIAEQEYLRAKEMREQLVVEDPSTYQPDLASICNNLGVLYADTKRIGLAEKEFLRAKEIREQLETENPSAYQPDLAESCNNLGILYKDTNRIDLAKQEFFQAKEICEQLVKISPERYTPDLQMVCEALEFLSEI